MKQPLRERIVHFINRMREDENVCVSYDSFMLVTIVISLIPLAFKGEHFWCILIDRITVVIFILDYLLRWVTADYNISNISIRSYIRYPFTKWAIIDLVAILASLSFINESFKVIRVSRVVRAWRVFRILKVMRYSKSFILIGKVFATTKDSLVAVCAFAGGYIFICALLIFNVEPDSFDTFFDAIYWATVSLTTVGYGDIYPVSTVGRLIAMVSSVFGIAIVALPAGIITAGYMNEIYEYDEDKKKSGDRGGAEEEKE